MVGRSRSWQGRSGRRPLMRWVRQPPWSGCAPASSRPDRRASATGSVDTSSPPGRTDRCPVSGSHAASREPRATGRRAGAGSGTLSASDHRCAPRPAADRTGRPPGVQDDVFAFATRAVGVDLGRLEWCGSQAARSARNLHTRRQTFCWDTPSSLAIRATGLPPRCQRSGISREPTNGLAWRGEPPSAKCVN